MRRFNKSIMFLAVITFVLLSWGQADRAGAQMVRAVKGKKKTEEAADKAVQVPEKLDSESVDEFLAPLSDEQVRRLLIAELQERAAREAAEREMRGEEEPGGLAGFVHNMRGLVNFTRARIRYLMSGATAFDDELPKAFGHLTESEGEPHPIKTSASEIALFAVGLLVYWLFRRFTSAARQRLETTPPATWLIRIWRLTLRSVLDLVSMCVFALATLALFFLFLDYGGPERLVVATYLAAFLIVMGVTLVSQFMLAPSAPPLRFFPLNDDDSLYIHKWIKRIAAVASFGFLTCGLIRLARISEATHLLLLAMVGGVICLMLVVMILQKRKAVAEAIAKDQPESKLRVQFAKVWHLLAIFFVFVLWVVAEARSLLIGFSADLPGVKTLLMIPLFFILDWILRSCLEFAFQIAGSPGDSKAAVEVESWDDEESDAVIDAGTDEPGKKALAERLDVSRMYTVFKTGLRILLAAFLIFVTLGFWGIELSSAKGVATSAFDILVTVLLAYVAWEFTRGYIDKKLREEMPDDDEDMEEGGAGGSRIGTLLILARKFILSVLAVMATLIVLSSLGVDIVPLIAGAGVVGLAIGFGAQTLVRDIIAGVFFLIDDAFRVGDYVQSGTTMGTVEQISLRSLRLRHHRGMIHTVPFGDMGSVTNYSRDYIIMKLTFRVRYDTNVDKVRKIIKKINKEISEDPEMGPSLLDKIKSQGVRELDDSAMIMRVKFKTIPGEQFVIRKEVFRRMQEAFHENGIEFAHRNVTVYLPPESPSTESEDQKDDAKKASEGLDEKVAAAAAAAAIAADEAEQREQQKK